MSRTSTETQGLHLAGRVTPAGSGLTEMLQAVARTVSLTVGYATVVINVYRPAWHDFEVVAVHGTRQARRMLLGTAATADQWAPLLDERFRRGEAYFVAEGCVDWELHGEAAYVPELLPLPHPEAWLPDDALLVPLRACSGELLGVLSVDEPRSGLRPTDDELSTLTAVAAQAALAVESAQRAEEAARRHAEAQQLLAVSSELTGQRRLPAMLERVGTGIAEALHFDKVVVYVRDGDAEALRPAASAGWTADDVGRMPRVSLEEAGRLLQPEFEHHGCVLLERAEAHRLVRRELRDVYRSRSNGRGPHAWQSHWLLVPLRDAGGALEGLIWVDDPRDRLKPGPDRLRVLRTFGDQVSSALETARALQRLGDLADRDPLTGLRNRRGLRERIDELIHAAPAGAVGLAVYDLDAFKRVNDLLGYETGDRVLAAVAAGLNAACPPDGLAVRLGGEDFALVVPAMDPADALAQTERVRRDVSAAMTMVPWPVTLSTGVAVSGDRLTDASALLRAATRALFAAKRLGRDRSVLYSAESLEVLLGSLEDGAGGEQLGAMILLAETLDLRDPHTARHSQTVGRHAEQIAVALGWPEARVDRVRIAGVLHDIGKLGLPDATLHKPEALDPREWDEIRRHPEMGARILDHANLRDVAAWVLCHHERIDGGGYPRGLAGEQIPLEARILSVADAYEAMTADRPYRPALPAAEAVQELIHQRGRQFDADVVDAFIALLAGPCSTAVA